MSLNPYRPTHWLSPTAEETLVVAEVVKVISPSTPEVKEPSAPPEPIFAIKRFESIEAYFKDANPNPLTYRQEEPMTGSTIRLKIWERCVKSVTTPRLDLIALSVDNERRNEKWAGDTNLRRLA